MDSTYLTPVTLQTSTSYTVPDKTIKFPERWNESFDYRPQQDITSYEVSLIMLLFYPTTYIDAKSFINEHKLNRHFIEIYRP